MAGAHNGEAASAKNVNAETPAQLVSCSYAERSTSSLSGRPIMIRWAFVSIYSWDRSLMARLVTCTHLASRHIAPTLRCSAQAGVNLKTLLQA